MNPIISVIIPVYNKEKYIGRCIESVLSQRYNNLEIILVDDGSEDNSGIILDNYTEKYDKIKVFHIKNGGVLAARNFGLENSTGEYITFIDADDTIEADYIDILFKALYENDCDIAQCNYANIIDNKRTPVSDTGELILQSANEAIEYIMSGKKYIVGLCPKLYKKNLFTNIPDCTGIKINEDYIVNFCAFQNAKKTVFIDLPLYNYYCNDDSVTHTIDNVKSCQDVNKVAELILERSKNKSYSKLAESRYQRSFIELYSAMLFSKNIGKEQTKECLNVLKKILKSDNCLNSKEKTKARMLVCFPSFYKFSYKIYDKIRKPKLDPVQ